jgi:cyclopropane fatty-acyl-phospholipid synthase-like methyltransferase
MATTLWNDTAYRQLLEENKQEQQAFISKLTGYLQPSANSTLLEVGCGTGANAALLAAKGLDTTGIDFSFSNIDAAKPQERDGLQFYQHDIRQPFWINYFDYAVNFFTHFGYFRTRREHEAAIRTISQSLNAKGTLLIDYLNVHYAEDTIEAEKVLEIDGYYFQISQSMDEDNFYKKVTVNHSSFAAPETFTQQTAKFSLGDFTDMLAYQGMQIREVFGDYNLGSYHVRKTPRMIMLAQKVK